MWRCLMTDPPAANRVRTCRSRRRRLFDVPVLGLLLLTASLVSAVEPAPSASITRHPIGEVRDPLGLGPLVQIDRREARARASAERALEALPPTPPEAASPELGYRVGRALDALGLPSLAGLWLRPRLGDDRFGAAALVLLVRGGLRTGDTAWVEDLAVPDVPLPADVADTLALEAARRAITRDGAGDPGVALALLRTVPEDSPRAAAARVLEGLALARPSRPGEPPFDASGAIAAFAAALRLVQAAEGTPVSVARAARLDLERDLALLGIARVLYASERFDEAARWYDTVPLGSARWEQAQLEAAWADFLRGEARRSILRLGPLLDPGEVHRDWRRVEPLPEVSAEMLRASEANASPDARDLQILLAYEATIPVIPSCRPAGSPPGVVPAQEALRALDAATASLAADATGWLESLDRGQVPDALSPWLEAMPDLERLRARRAAIGLERRALASRRRNVWSPQLEEALRELELRSTLDLAAATRMAIPALRARANELLVRSRLVRFESVEAMRANIDCGG